MTEVLARCTPTTPPRCLLGSRRLPPSAGLTASPCTANWARRRLPVWPCAGAAAAAVLAVVLPAGLVAATAIVSVTLWLRTRRRVRTKRRTSESTALQGALEVLVGELRVGAHPVAAFDVAA